MHSAPRRRLALGRATATSLSAAALLCAGTVLAVDRASTAPAHASAGSSVAGTTAGNAGGPSATLRGRTYRASATLATRGKIRGRVVLVVTERTRTGRLVQRRTSRVVAVAQGRPVTATLAVRARGTGNRVTATVEHRGGARRVVTRRLSVATIRGRGAREASLLIDAGNITTNPSFESVLGGWRGISAGLTRVQGPGAVDGTWALRATRTSGSSFGIADSPDTVGVSQRDRVYTASASVRAATSASVGRQVNIRIVESNPSGRVVRRTASSTVPLASQPRRISISAPATATGNRVGIEVIQASGKQGHAFDVDAVVMTAASPAPAPAPQPAPTPEPAPAPAPTPEPTPAPEPQPAPAPAPMPTGNLIANPSFETALHGWATWQGTLSRLAVSGAPDGQHVVRVSHASGTSFTINDAPATIAASAAGQSMTARAHVRAGSPSSVGRPVTITLRERDGGGAVIRQTSSAPVALGTAFQAIQVTAVAAGNGNAVDLRISHGSAASGNAFDVDAITLVADGTSPAPAPQPPAPAPTPTPVPDPVLDPDPAPVPNPLAPAELLPYDPQALFNQPVAGLPLHSRSAGIAANMAQNARTVKINASIAGEVPSVYVASPTDGFYSITIDGRAERFRVPAGAIPGSGSDHPLVILDPNHPDHGEKVELRVWQATIDHTTKRVVGNGVGLFHYNNDGRRLNPDGSRSVSLPFRGWGTGSQLSYTAGLLRPHDIQSGRVRHALRIALGCNDFTNAFVAPATKTDQSATRCNGSLTPAGGKVDMGMRMRLPASVNCDSRVAPVLPGRTESNRETAFLRIVCRGLQEYGLIVLDGTVNDGVVMYMENDATANWAPIAGQTLYGGYGYVFRDATTPGDGMSRNANHGIPWSQLEVVA